MSQRGTRWTLFALLVTFLLPLVPATGANAASAKRTRMCARLRVSAADGETKRKRRKRARFSATHVTDLQFRVLTRKLEGEHHVSFKVYAPDGYLYQTLSVHFQAQHDVDRRGNVRRRKYQPVTATLPLAGTSITASSLYGTWRVEAHLDSGQATCTAPRKFVIKP